MSISKQQAAALAEGFLDNIGSDEEFQPRSTFTETILIAGEFIEDAQSNLEKNIATGNLSESLEAAEPVKTGDILRIDIYMNYYGKFINKGVKGTRSGTSKAGYSFKYENPSKSHVEAIRAWIKAAKISTRTVKKYKGYGVNETKRKSVAQIDSAYAMAKSIKIKGIKPTGFLDRAADKTTKKIRERLGLALRIDIIDALKA